MEQINNNVAPIVSISTVAPSLDSSPSKTPKSFDRNTPIYSSPEDKNEVKFDVSISTESDSDSDSDFEEGTKKPKIPDGGWGWMIVFASLILSMIADGISFSFGLLFVEFLHEFNASKSITSWIGSLFMAVPLLSGPVMSAFVDKYGCRSMTIIGGLISAFGFILSSKVNSIGIMYLTFGTLSGLGLGLCYVTAVVSIAFWFDKKRTLAVGLGAAGTGIGTFVYSPLTTFLIKEFGWRGTTLILSGSFLNMCVCGALMRDPDWIIQQNKQTSKSVKSSKTSLLSVSSNFANVVDINELKAVLKSGKDAEYLLHSLETSMKQLDSETPRKFHQSVLNLPTFIKQNEKIVLGWAGDQKWMNITKTYAVSLVFCGLSCAGMMFFTSNFLMLEICSGFFGLFLSSSFSFTPGILVELVPLERFTIAYGLQLMCMGIGNLLGPPYAGLLFDITGTWDQSFYQASVWIAISGLLIGIIPYTKNRKIIGEGPVEKELGRPKI